jgi:hypothetical protein
VYSLVENHDFSTVCVLFNKILDEFQRSGGFAAQSSPCKAVFVGNHKFSLISFKQSSQYGFKPFTLKVEPASDATHELDLSLEVISLFGTTDTAVTNPNSFLIFPNK